MPGSDLNVPIVHQGELLGAISVTMPKDEPLRPAGQQLVADVASQAGLALANAGLIEDLRTSRQLLHVKETCRRYAPRTVTHGRNMAGACALEDLALRLACRRS